MAHIAKSIHIAAPVEAVFDYATVIASIPEWYTSMVEVRNATHPRVRKGASYEWVFKMLGMRFDGKAEYVDVVPNERIVTRTEGGIPSKWEFRYAPDGDGCRVSVTVDYTVPGKLLGKIADKLFIEGHNERDLEHALANLKAHCEAMARAGAPA